MYLRTTVAFSFAAVLLGSYAGAQCVTQPILPCVGQVIVAPINGEGFLSLTHCPLPACRTVAPVTVSIVDAAGTHWTESFPTPFNPTQTECSRGSDQYYSSTHDRLKFIFGAEATVLATHLSGFPLQLVAPVQVSITDCDGYAIGVTGRQGVRSHSHVSRSPTEQPTH